MIAALFALAAAMIIGGAAAVVQGFPYVRLESGMAMVVAGSVAASSGAVLLGLAVVAAGLRRIERAARLPSAARAGVPADPVAPVDADGRSRLPPVPQVLPPDPPPAPSPVAPPIEAAAGRSLSAAAPDVPSPTATAEPELPMPGLTAEAGAPEPPAARAAEAEAARRVAPEDDLFAAPAAPGEAGPDPLLRPSLEAGDGEPAAAVAKPERVVVGRHSSGGNTYVMFDNGTIEADTPNGRFTFSSLEELRAFVDAGGETGARGAA